MIELRPTTLRPRRPWPAALWVVAAAAAGAGGATWIAREPTVVLVIDVPAPPAEPSGALPAPAPTIEVSFPITIHIAPPAPRDDQLGPCPAPHRRATGVALGSLPEPVTSVAASWFDTRLIVAWSSAHVYASTDEGRSFRRVLEHAGTVGHAAFDCHGRLHAARIADDGAIDLGTFDDGAAEPERWVRVAATAAETHANGNTSLGDVRLVAFAGDVAVIAPEPGSAAQLAITRRDERGRWRSSRLLERAPYASYGSWDGIAIVAVEPRGGDRVRLLVTPYQGGECGYNVYADTVLDLRSLETSITGFDEELPASRHPREIDGLHDVSRDVAGRWLGIDDQEGVVRLTARELAERERAAASGDD